MKPLLGLVTEIECGHANFGLFEYLDSRVDGEY